MSTHIRLARSSPGPVEADWKTEAYVAERRQRVRSYNTQLMKGDDDAVDRPDERVIWSPFRLQRRKRSGVTSAARASESAPR